MIVYKDSVEGISPGDLCGFFVGWQNPPSNETHLKILKNSSFRIIASDDETGSVVGFITAISDMILSAYIPLLEVLPEYKEKGIGSELVRRLMTKLDKFYMIDLTCDEEIQKFYEKFGLSISNGMSKRNYKKQNGI
jgi:ribosomal protein S18 acetylase RimI-like enzyme